MVLRLRLALAFGYTAMLHVGQQKKQAPGGAEEKAGEQMTKQEREMLKFGYQRIYRRLQYVKECAARGIRGFDCQDAWTEELLTDGYRGAIVNILNCGHRQTYGNQVVEQWEEEVMQQRRPIDDKE